METLMLKFQDSFFSRLFKVYGTSMTPNLLLMCKILLAMLVAHGFFSYLNDPFVPFIAALDEFNKIPFVFEYLLKSVFIVSSILLLFNIRVRTMAVVLGITIIITLLASKTVFRNHLFIVGCMLFLSGLSQKNKTPWLLYFQLSLIYFGALTNKMMEIDWWTGQFMHNWLGEALKNEVYLSVSEILPDRLLAKLISYSAMLSELTIGICLLFPRFRFFGVGLIFVFHILLFTFTGETFGFFMENVLIILIAFLVWPKEPVIVKYRSIQFASFFKLWRIVDWDKRFIFQYDQSLNSQLELNSETKTYKNKVAFVYMLIYNANFFVTLIFVEMGLRFLFGDFIRYLILLIYFWTIILVLSPLVLQRCEQKKTRVSKFESK